MNAKKPISLNQHLQNWQMQTDLSQPNLQPSEQAPCEHCRDLGLVKDVLEEGILGVKAERPRLISCPSCLKGQMREREIQERRMQRTQLPRQYADADLLRWGDPRHESRREKLTAFLACRAMLEDARHLISSHRLAQYHLKLLGNESPAWVEKLLGQPDRSRNGVVLWGDYGVGKTWLAAATMNALAQLNSYVLYVRMSDLMQDIKDTWYGDDKTSALIRNYQEAQVLFIDDMSDSSRDEKPLPPYQQDYATMIMRSRMGNMKPTIVTTNWNSTVFERKWGSGCYEVMAAHLYWIEMKGRVRDVSNPLEG
jgi:DNA replication protein DnaC